MSLPERPPELARKAGAPPTGGIYTPSQSPAPTALRWLRPWTSDKSGPALDRDVKTMDPASSTEEQKKAAAAEAGVSRVWD